MIYICIKKEENEAEAFTTKTMAAKWLEVSTATLLRGFKNSNIIDRPKYSIYQRNSIIKAKMGKGGFTL